MYPAVQNHVPRVIHNAVNDGAQPQPLPAGYSPALVVQMARAHKWAPYDAVATALRSLAQENLVQKTAREAARETVRELFQHPTPFDSNVRFPKGELYLCVDHGEFGQAMYQIQKELLRVEAAAKLYSSWRLVEACGEFMEAVSSAATKGTLYWQVENGAQVVYDRAIFEEDFHLTWTDDAA